MSGMWGSLRKRVSRQTPERDIQILEVPSEDSSTEEDITLTSSINYFDTLSRPHTSTIDRWVEIPA